MNFFPEDSAGQLVLVPLFIAVLMTAWYGGVCVGGGDCNSR